MKQKTKKWLWVLFIFGVVPFCVQAQTKKMTICYAALNSESIKNTFLRNLSKTDFQFVDLTKDFYLTPDQHLNEFGATGANERWFDEACKKFQEKDSKAGCDLLLITGEFSEFFFGSSGLALSLGTLERHFCKMDCGHILNRPKIVILPACNTLDKPGDFAIRSPQRQAERLDSHFLSAEEIDQRIGNKYYGFGHSIRDRVRRIFHHVTWIYGFSDTSISAGDSARRFRKYFSSLREKKASFKKFLTHPLSNLSLYDFQPYFYASAFMKVKGLTEKEMKESEEEDYSSLMCFIKYFDTKPYRKLERIKTQVIEKHRILPFLDLMEAFFSNEGEFQSAIRGRKDLQEAIKENHVAAEIYRNKISDIRVPGLRFRLEKIAQKLGWISENETKALAAELFLQNLQPPLTIRKVRSALVNFSQVKMFLSPDQVSSELLDTSLGWIALSVVRPESPHLFARKMNQMIRETKDPILKEIVYLATLQWQKNFENKWLALLQDVSSSNWAPLLDPAFDFGCLVRKKLLEIQHRTRSNSLTQKHEKAIFLRDPQARKRFRAELENGFSQLTPVQKERLQLEINSLVIERTYTFLNQLEG